MQSGDTASITYSLSHVDSDTMNFMIPDVTWLKDGVPVNVTPTNTPQSNGDLTTVLSFIFDESDAGVYQCVLTDTARFEVFVTDPIRLDTGECIH